MVPSKEFEEQVATLIRDVATRELLPRFRALREADVHEKDGGELVTAADVAAEKRLAEGLRAIDPTAAFVGEETVAANTSVRDRLDDSGRVWVVDPLDGTMHFAAGDDPFGIMVALVADGVTERAWIYMPRTGVMATAMRGGGAYLNGAPVALCFDDDSPPRGALHTLFLPPRIERSVRTGRRGLDVVAPQRCAAQRYVQLLAGAEQFALYWRTEPWDHAAGVLLVEEAGGRARRPDGSAYRANDKDEGLLVATSSALWKELRDRLLPAGV